ncbi:MAG: type III-B CRISPR module RAMP protein Cmr6 [Campylobacteraceae bacterium]|jgi:CRISPR-associated protein Cmr6|nr:type III-B CRISPR module RAMP protein Cmr6 [Campylobacteraceae bacterium]
MPINKVSSNRQGSKQSLDDFFASRKDNQQRNSGNKQSNSQGSKSNNGYKSQNNNNSGRNNNGNTRDENSGNGLYPIPQHLVELLKKSTANFSLSFVRLMEWRINDDATEKIKDPKDLKDQNKSILSAKKFCDDANKKLPNIQNELNLIHNRQKEIISELGTLPIEIKAKLISPFISGLGAGHPNETGMILDRNTGCPFIPASSIKGVLRLAYAINLAKDNQDIIEDKELDKYFGSTDANNSKHGQLVILDAYPTSAPKIKLDIMNPHYSDYYGKKENHKLPIETENPVPIKFISVKEGTEFIFRAFFLPFHSETFTENDKSAIKAAFKKAFNIVGFGGKTVIGYGRFETIK